MSERENILGRVREALRTRTQPPRVHGAGHAVGAGGKGDYGRFLPKPGTTFAEQATLFAAQAAELKAEFQLLSRAEDLAPTLQAMLVREAWKRAASHRTPLTLEASRLLALPVLWTDGPFDPMELEQCDVGITECDVLVAQTGTVVLTSRTGGGRALNVLPPHHLVLARHSQLVGGLPEAFGRLREHYGETFPSMTSFITGPSRTGDIERILVLGAHGPKKLTILCLPAA